jgi:hypothetical protein
MSLGDGHKATLTDSGLGSVVTLLDEVRSSFCQRLGHLPAALDSELPDRCEQQALGQEQRHNRHGFSHSIQDVTNPRTAGSKAGPYGTRPTLGEAPGKINHGIVGRLVR